MSLVGENIDAYCTKCKLILAHVVLYEIDGAVRGVKCKTCGSEHKYREKKVQTKSTRAVKSDRQEKPRKTAPKGRKVSKVSSLQWELKFEEMDVESRAKNYHIQDTYSIDDVIRHPVFGIGFVIRVVSETRMEVLFKDSVKLMAMNTMS